MAKLVRPLFGSAVLLALVGLLATRPAQAETPALSKKIDQLIAKRLEAAKVPASPLADDAEFLRRAYLDITGRIPTYEQTTAFLASSGPDKRARLIDELLARPEYGLHFATIWRELLVDRTPENGETRQGFSWEFIDWLAGGFNKGRGWNDIVTDMLTAEGEAKKNPATTLILANRMNNFPRPADLTSTVGRLFMGMQLRCAQCHDHPYVDDWKHDDFWGVAAFFSQVRDHGMAPDGNARAPVLYDRPDPDTKKETSYINRLKRAGLLPPLAGAEIAIPTAADPTKTAKVVKARFFLGDAPELGAKDSPRARLAAWLTSADNPFFARTAANRTWAHLFARGLVSVDDSRPNQPPSHPELLALLEAEFKASGFDFKPLIRAICNSDTYQRTSKPVPGNAADRELFSHMAVKILNADQVIDALAIATGRSPTTGKNRDQQTAPFVTREADDDTTEFSNGIPQFLLLMNGGAANNSPNLGKLTQGKTKEEAVRAMYLSALSRQPRAEELKRMIDYVDQGPMPAQRYRDVYWVLLNSAEFIANH